MGIGVVLIIGGLSVLAFLLCRTGPANELWDYKQRQKTLALGEPLEPMELDADPADPEAAWRP